MASPRKRKIKRLAALEVLNRPTAKAEEKVAAAEEKVSVVEEIKTKKKTTAKKTKSLFSKSTEE